MPEPVEQLLNGHERTGFDYMVAFLNGYDAAVMGALLQGIKELLSVKAESIDEWAPWSMLVRRVAEIVQPDPLPENIKEYKERMDCRVLCDAIRELYASRAAPGGMSVILEEYEELKIRVQREGGISRGGSGPIPEHAVDTAMSRTCEE